MFNAPNIAINWNPKRVKINVNPVVLKINNDTRNMQTDPRFDTGPAAEIIMFSYSGHSSCSVRNSNRIRRLQLLL